MKLTEEEPNCTAVVVDRFSPLIRTVVPPAEVPVDGLIDDTAGRFGVASARAPASRLAAANAEDAATTMARAILVTGRRKRASEALGTRVSSLRGTVHPSSSSRGARDPGAIDLDLRSEFMRIEVWSDVACPWCYIGKRNLERALDELDLGDEVEVRWRAYELDPGAPPSSSLGMAEVLSRKYGVSVEEAREMNARMTAAAAKVGLEYHLDTAQLGNSFDAHRLAKLADERGLGGEMAERLFAAHFTESQLISDRDTLLDLAIEVGLDVEEAVQVLDTDAYADEVRGDEEFASEAGFSGVPTYVVDGRLAIPGAQPPDVLVRLLGRMAANEPLDD